MEQKDVCVINNVYLYYYLNITNKHTKTKHKKTKTFKPNKKISSKFRYSKKIIVPIDFYE